MVESHLLLLLHWHKHWIICRISSLPALSPLPLLQSSVSSTLPCCFGSFCLLSDILLSLTALLLCGLHASLEGRGRPECFYRMLLLMYFQHTRSQCVCTNFHSFDYIDIEHFFDEIDLDLDGEISWREYADALYTQVLTKT